MCFPLAHSSASFLGALALCLVFWYLREYFQWSPSLVIHSLAQQIMFSILLYSGTSCICPQQSCSMSCEATRWESDPLVDFRDVWGRGTSEGSWGLPLWGKLNVLQAYPASLSYHYYLEVSLLRP